MTHSLRIIPGLLLAAFGSLACAAPGWVGTATRATQVFSDAGEPVAAAEEVVPGQEVRIAVSLKLRNRESLDQRIERIHAGSAAFIGAGELAARHLPTAAQVERVVQHLRQAGFRDIAVSASRLLVSASGSAANVKAAFNTTLHNFGSGDQRVYGNVADAQVPAALADDVLAVHGLQNAYRLHPTYQLADAGTDARPRPVGHSPTDFPLIYNASGLPPASGARLGIVAAGDMAQTLVDLGTFESNVGFAPVSTTIVHAGASGSDTSGTIEWDLDSQSSLAAAGGALQEMVFYVGTSFQNADIQAAFDAAVTANHAKVVNVSLGECEIDAMNSGFTASGDQTFALAVSQGQTFSVSTGDAGAKECGRRKGPQGSYPAVSPFVMAIGGTTVITSGTTTYGSEKVWRGAGGSPSSTEAAPSWQLASGVLGTSTQRGVPDVSFDANPSSGAKIVFNGGITQVGGTSLAAPLFAGFWARIMAQSSKTLGFPDPSIYMYGGGNPGLFHDVTTGSNGGETAAAGWDYASGWGSLDIGALATFIANTPGF